MNNSTTKKNVSDDELFKISHILADELKEYWITRTSKMLADNFKDMQITFPQTVGIYSYPVAQLVSQMICTLASTQAPEHWSKIIMEISGSFKDICDQIISDTFVTMKKNEDHVTNKSKNH